MNSFPVWFKIENGSKFNKKYYDICVKVMRQEIFTHVLSRRDENEYYNVESFGTRHLNGDIERAKSMAHKIADELINRGWSCILAYGETALFIYSGTTPPVAYGEEI